MTAEDWRTIPGWPGYEVSSLGNMRSLKPGKAGPKTPHLDRGYWRVKLSANGRAKLWELVTAGELTPVRIGRRTFYERNDLERYIESLRHTSPAASQEPDAACNTALVRLASGSIARRCRTCGRDQ